MSLLGRGKKLGNLFTAKLSIRYRYRAEEWKVGFPQAHKILKGIEKVDAGTLFTKVQAREQQWTPGA